MLSNPIMNFVVGGTWLSKIATVSAADKAATCKITDTSGLQVAANRAINPVPKTSTVSIFYTTCVFTFVDNIAHSATTITPTQQDGGSALLPAIFYSTSEWAFTPTDSNCADNNQPTCAGAFTFPSSALTSTDYITITTTADLAPPSTCSQSAVKISQTASPPSSSYYVYIISTDSPSTLTPNTSIICTFPTIIKHFPSPYFEVQYRDLGVIYRTYELARSDVVVTLHTNCLDRADNICTAIYAFSTHIPFDDLFTTVSPILFIPDPTRKPSVNACLETGVNPATFSNGGESMVICQHLRKRLQLITYSPTGIDNTITFSGRYFSNQRVEFDIRQVIFTSPLTITRGTSCDDPSDSLCKISVEVKYAGPTLHIGIIALPYSNVLAETECTPSMQYKGSELQIPPEIYQKSFTTVAESLHRCDLYLSKGISTTFPASALSIAHYTETGQFPIVGRNLILSGRTILLDPITSEHTTIAAPPVLQPNCADENNEWCSVKLIGQPFDPNRPYSQLKSFIMSFAQSTPAVMNNEWFLTTSNVRGALSITSRQYPNDFDQDDPDGVFQTVYEFSLPHNSDSHYIKENFYNAPNEPYIYEIRYRKHFPSTYVGPTHRIYSYNGVPLTTPYTSTDNLAVRFQPRTGLEISLDCNIPSRINCYITFHLNSTTINGAYFSIENIDSLVGMTDPDNLLLPEPKMVQIADSDQILPLLYISFEAFFQKNPGVTSLTLNAYKRVGFNGMFRATHYDVMETAPGIPISANPISRTFEAPMSFLKDGYPVFDENCGISSAEQCTVKYTFQSTNLIVNEWVLIQHVIPGDSWISMVEMQSPCTNTDAVVTVTFVLNAGLVEKNYVKLSLASSTIPHQFTRKDESQPIVCTLTYWKKNNDHNSFKLKYLPLVIHNQPIDPSTTPFLSESHYIIFPTTRFFILSTYAEHDCLTQTLTGSTVCTFSVKINASPKYPVRWLLAKGPNIPHPMIPAGLYTIYTKPILSPTDPGEDNTLIATIDNHYFDVAQTIRVMNVSIVEAFRDKVTIGFMRLFSPPFYRISAPFPSFVLNLARDRDSLLPYSNPALSFPATLTGQVMNSNNNITSVDTESFVRSEYEFFDVVSHVRIESDLGVGTAINGTVPCYAYRDVTSQISLEDFESRVDDDIFTIVGWFTRAQSGDTLLTILNPSTIKNTKCYTYHKINLQFPTRRIDVSHMASISKTLNPYLAGLEFRFINSYPRYVKSALITPVDEYHNIKDAATSQSLFIAFFLVFISLVVLLWM